MGLNLLRLWMHHDLAVKDRMALAVQHAAIVFHAEGARFQMIDAGVVIDMLLAVRHIQAVHVDGGALGREPAVYVVARQCAAQRDGMRFQPAVPILAHIEAADVAGVQAFLLNFIMPEHGPGAERHLADRVGKIIRLIQPDIAFDQGGLGPLIEDQQIARMGGVGLAACL